MASADTLPFILRKTKPKNDLIAIRIPPSEKAWLQAIADAQDRSLGGVVRQLIRDAIARQIPRESADPPAAST